MKSVIPLALATLLLAGCATYKNAPTPDDVYYSSQRAPRSQDEYVDMGGNGNQYRYNGEENAEDNYLRMKVANPNRWSLLDNEYYNYSPLSMGLGYGYSPFSNYYSPFGYNSLAFGYGLGLGGYYNPYMLNYYSPYAYYSPYGYGGYSGYYPYGGIKTVGSTTPVYNQPRRTNLNIFNRGRTNNNYVTPRAYYDANNNNNTRYRDAGSNLRSNFGSNNSSFQSSTPSRSSGSSGGGGRRF